MDMTGIYGFCFVFGTIFLLLSAAGGMHHHFHLHFGGVGHHAGAFIGHHIFHYSHGSGNHEFEEALNPANLRNLFAFMAGFGAIGLLSILGVWGFILSLVLSVAAGLLMFLVSYLAWAILVNSQSNSLLSDGDFQWSRGKVTVGIPSDGKLGRITAVVDERNMSLMALPFKEGESFKAGEEVAIVEYKEGVAKVVKV